LIQAFLHKFKLFCLRSLAESLRYILAEQGKGARVSDESSVVAVAVVGAVIGAAVGCLLFTARGRELRRKLEAALESAVGELNSLRTTVQKTADFAAEGWKLVNEVVGDPSIEPPRYASSRQTAPF
jgi:hypothetical protein